MVFGLVCALLGPGQPRVPNEWRARFAHAEFPIMVGESGTYGDSLDAELFGAVLQELENDNYGGELRVDPRPLKNDPRLVTISAFDGTPDLIEPDLWRAPVEDGAGMSVSRRRVVLQARHLTEADGLRRPQCPGALRITTPEVEARRAAHCPSQPYRVAMVATPREGGAFWPGNLDERTKYGSVGVVTMRAIVTKLSPQGSIQVSTDFVFRRQSAGWRLLEARRLLMLE